MPCRLRTGSAAVVLLFLVLSLAPLLADVEGNAPVALRGNEAATGDVENGAGGPRSGYCVLLSGVCPNPVWPESGDVIPDEFVVISNTGGSAASLDGWALSDGEGETVFPPGVSIPAGGSVHVTANGSAFLKTMGMPADFEWNSIDAVTPDMALAGNLWLANTGDEMTLLDAGAVIVDFMAWGDGDLAVAGWSGPRVPAPSEGEVLMRNREDGTGGFEDTDRRDDWLHWRKYWAGQSKIGPTDFFVDGEVIPFVSPDSSFAVIVGEIDGADTSVDIEIYQFTNWHVAERLLAALDRGVEVRLLLEGNPVGWHMETWGEQNPDVNQEKYIASELVKRGAEVRFMVNDADRHVKNRYYFIHAKYAVFDGKRSMVMTENLKESGVPTDPCAGNRGWGIVVEDEGLAQYLTDLFEDDRDGLHPDIFPFTPGHDKYGEPAEGFELNVSTPAGDHREHFYPLAVKGTVKVTPVIAPDTSLLPGSGVLALLEGAEDYVLAQLFYFTERWDRDGLTGTNPYLLALLDAARRGCCVRVILDSSDYDKDREPDNAPSCEYLNGVAGDEGLDLVAILIDTDMTNLNKSHNKGLVVDGTKVLVSSINWNINSVTNNREVALVVESPEVAGYFERVFRSDWENRPPVAVAPDDIAILPGGNVSLNGSFSYDPDGDPLTCVWDYSDGPVHHVMLSERSFPRRGRYEAVLQVEDGRGGTDTDVVNITVNTLPVAVISGPGTHAVTAGEPILFDGSCSYDADGDVLSYRWSFGDRTENAGVDGTGENITHVFEEAGTYEVVLCVSDGLAFDNDSLMLTVVLTGNRPPVVLLSSPGEGDIFGTGKKILLDASNSTDPDGDILSFRWESDISGLLGTAARSFVVLAPGDHLIMLAVDDGMGHAVTVARNITVKEAGGPDGPDGGEENTFRASIIYPAEGQNVYGVVIVEVLLEVLVNGTVERIVEQFGDVDTSEEDDSVMLTIENGEPLPMYAEDDGWEYVWNTKALPDGPCTMIVSAHIDGSWGRNHSVTVNVVNRGDGTPPDDNKIGAGPYDGWPWCLLILIMAAILVVLIGGLAFLVIRNRKRGAAERSGGTGEEKAEVETGTAVKWEDD